MYVAGYSPRPFPLARFLPPVAEGVAATYAERFTAPNAVVVDPFGQSPRVALELARLGRKVIVTTNNPTLRLALGVALSPLPAQTLRLALTRLADARTATERVENYVRGLYRSTCPHCDNTVEVDAFEWDHEALTEKHYHCETCGQERTEPVDAADVELATRHAARGPHYHWALEQIAPGTDPDRDLYADALAIYTPRALSVLFTLTNKSSNLNLDEAERRALDILLLMAYDEALVFPASGQRPRSFKVPVRFRERNIWLALERLVRDGDWQSDGGPRVPVVALSEIGAQPGVVVQAGSIRDLAKALRANSIPCLMTALPRPNLVFWTLSALWAAWLWGPAEAEPLAQLIKRRRYDWAWHENALRSSFAAAQELLGHSGRLVTLLPQAEPGFVAACLMAADGAGYTLVDHALRADLPEAQFVFQPDSEPVTEEPDLKAVLHERIHEAAQQVLRQRGEPSRWPSVSGAVYVALAQHHLLRTVVKDSPNDPLTMLDDLIETTCTGSSRLVDLRAGANEDEGDASKAAQGIWWLVDPEGGVTESALADRTEQAVVQALLAAPTGLDFTTLEQQVCEAVPGLTLPGSALIRACVESYGQETDGIWTFRPEDAPLARGQDFEQLLEDLLRLGIRLGFTPVFPQSDEVIWPGTDPAWDTYHFYVTQTAQIGPTLLALGGYVPQPRTQRLIVMPGGRSALINYKVRRDPRLKRAIDEGGWLFIKYRHIRRVAAEPALTPTELLTILERDPLTEQTSGQLTLW
jgi:hypothetical protein